VKDEKSPEGAPPKKKTDHQSGSFLIRFWTEPREVEAEEETVRAFVRNLKTGEEQYLNDPQKLGELVLEALKNGPQEPAQPAGPADDASARKNDVEVEKDG
jgi:hypothetical protein